MPDTSSPGVPPHSQVVVCLPVKTAARQSVAIMKKMARLQKHAQYIMGKQYTGLCSQTYWNHLPTKTAANICLAEATSPPLHWPALMLLQVQMFPGAPSQGSLVPPHVKATAL